MISAAPSSSAGSPGSTTTGTGTTTIGATTTGTTSTATLCSALSNPLLPIPTAGQTGVIGGIYAIGGPALPCANPRPPESPNAGTVAILDLSGNVVANQNLGAGQTFSFPLPPGTYTAEASIGPQPSQGTNPFYCRSDGTFTITAGSQTVVPVICNVP